MDPGRALILTDPLSGETLGEASSRELEKIRVNNRMRRAVRDAIGTLTLMSEDAAVRLAAAETMARSPDPEGLDALDAALAAETDDTVRAAMQRARVAAIVSSDRPEAEKIEALAAVASQGDRAALALLTPLLASESDALREAAESAIAQINGRLAMWEAAQNVWYGLSLGSVLLLAAIGLAITFGVMGVINMAHGEMVMLGAYTTFVVQQTIRTSAPELFDWSLAIALPLAFLVAGTAGLIIERGVIRWLYGRPLETLLATWGVSLILQQAVRTIFGPTNREVGNPDWMSGAFELGGLTITWNRMWIMVFALAVFAVLLAVTRWTTFGLQMRAVTQNRRMAGSMGIRTSWVDAFTFALGSGIAGIAGVALSPDRQRLARSWPELHHRQFHGRGVRRRGQHVGHAGRRVHSRRGQQVPRALRRRGARQDLRARAHHPVHPEAPARPVRAEGAGGRILMSVSLHARPGPARNATHPGPARDRRNRAGADAVDGAHASAARAEPSRPAIRKVPDLRFARRRA